MVEISNIPIIQKSMKMSSFCPKWLTYENFLYVSACIGGGDTLNQYI